MFVSVNAHDRDFYAMSSASNTNMDLQIKGGKT